MADSCGAENLRKQIAFLSNLIDSHKNNKQKENPILKTTQNVKHTKTWSQRNGENSSSKNKSYLSHNQCFQSKFSTTTKPRVAVENQVKTVQKPVLKTGVPYYVIQKQTSASSMEYKLHRTVRSTKSVPASKYSCTFPPKTTARKVVTKAPMPSYKTPLKAAGRMVVSTRLTKTQTSAVTRPIFKATSMTSINGPSVKHKINPVGQSNGKLKWTKNGTIHDSKRTAESKATSNSTFKTFTKSCVPSSCRTIKPVAKAAVPPAKSTLCNSHSNSYSVASRKVLLPKTHIVSSGRETNTTKNKVRIPINTTFKVQNFPKRDRTNTKLSSNATTKSSMQSSTVSKGEKLRWQCVSFNQLKKNLKSNPACKTRENNSNVSTRIATKSCVQSTIPPKGAKLKWRRVSTSNALKNYSTSKTHRINSNVCSTNRTKSSVQCTIPPNGAKLKWRRVSASFKNDLKNNLASKTRRINSNVSSTNATKSSMPSTILPKGAKLKWRRASFSQSKNDLKSKSTCKTRRKISSVSSIKATKSNVQSSALPKRAKLKWRRRSANHLRNDSHQTASSLLAYGHQRRIALKSKWGRSGANSTQLRKTVSNTRVYHLRNPSLTLVKRSATSSRNPLLRTWLNHYPNSAVILRGRKATINGNDYVISSRGKTLKKTLPSKENRFSIPVERRNTAHVYCKSSADSSINAMSRIFRRQNSVDKNKTRTANKILKRTLQNVQATMKKTKKQKSEEYCMFYNKFGKCTKHQQGICPYLHDPTKIAVCTRFLRGKCQQMGSTCPFSHKIDKEKMPICQYFLKGKCNKEDCPYSHVYVGQQAVICEDFLKGYCALGFKCTKKHVLECEEFSTTGQCANQSKCKLIHREKSRQRKRYFDGASWTPDEEDCIRQVKKARQNSSDGFLPLEAKKKDIMRHISWKEHDKIDLAFFKDECRSQDYSSEGYMDSDVSLRIRPNFTSKVDSEKA